MKLKFIRPESGDWLVIQDAYTEEQIYSGHGSGDQMWDVLTYLGVIQEEIEISDEEFEEKYS